MLFKQYKLRKDFDLRLFVVAFICQISMQIKFETLYYTDVVDIKHYERIPRRVSNQLITMLKTLIVLCACIVSVFSTPLEVGSFYLPRVFDYDLYENALDPELCQEQLANMNTFDCKLL